MIKPFDIRKLKSQYKRPSETKCIWLRFIHKIEYKLRRALRSRLADRIRGGNKRNNIIMIIICILFQIAYILADDLGAFVK